MFIGHFSAAFVAAAASRRAPSLTALFVGAQLVDWGFFTFSLIGLEKMRIVPGITAMNPLDLYFMPYTHSLLVRQCGDLRLLWSHWSNGGMSLLQ